MIERIGIDTLRNTAAADIDRIPHASIAALIAAIYQFTALAFHVVRNICRAVLAAFPTVVGLRNIDAAFCGFLADETKLLICITAIRHTTAAHADLV